MSISWWDVVDCTGRTVLDLGGYDGGWGAKPALLHGALRATVVDNGEWKQYAWAAPGIEHPDIVYVEGDLLSWDEPADIVIASNVIYHLREPIGGLKHIRKLTRECCVIRTSTVLDAEAGPDGWKWYEAGMGHENGTVWARPCESGFLRALEETGFGQIQPIEVYGGFTVVCRPG